MCSAICRVKFRFIPGVDGLQCRAHQKLLPLQTSDLQQVEPAKLLSNPKILNSEFLDLKVSQSLFVNIYQCHTVLNVISDRRQFTLKLIREWVAPLSTAWPEETKPEIFLGKETEFWSIFRILYDAVLPPSDPSSFTFPLWFIRSAGGTEKLQKYLTTLNFHF